jgi:hypothetical protein
MSKEETQTQTEKVGNEPLTVEPVMSETPRYEFSGQGLPFQTETETSEEEISQQRQRRQPYTIPEGLLGKAINALLKFIASKYPEIETQLMLGQEEEELLDVSFKPMIEKLLKQTKTDASIVTLILAVSAIIIPRLLLIARAESERRKVAKIQRVERA